MSDRERISDEHREFHQKAKELAAEMFGEGTNFIFIIPDKGMMASTIPPMGICTVLSGALHAMLNGDHRAIVEDDSDGSTNVVGLN